MIPPLSLSRAIAAGLLTTVLSAAPAQADPLRVFFRGGPKSHGPGAHEHERFLKEGRQLLAERGATTDGAMSWPTAEQIGKADVIVAYAQEGGDAAPEQQQLINNFVKRGGGLVVIHTATVSMKDPAWWKSVIGGSWVPNRTKWREGPMDLYYVENQQLGGGHPITKGAANFHIDDEIYYDMDISPDVRVLATSYTPKVIEGRRPAEGNKPHIYDIQPQMWTYEKTAEGGTRPYRAFVSIPGHLYTTFEKPHYRAILLRGIAWAGKRENLDEFCTPEELSTLTYPEGGPQRPADTLANLEIHPDFEMSLVAAEPLITKPMNFDWDASGRLWVAETPEYPNGRRGMRPDYRGREWKDHGGIDPTTGVQDRPARDKISILTDTNNDGVMDHKEIFYEGLDLVTGLVFYKDGVIVTQAPEILFLRDTDRDGKADKVEKLYTNLGTSDTHAVINNPRMGWDGWIYATHGYSATSDARNGDGSKHFGTIGSGVVRFKPDGSAIEQFSSKGGNTWGLEITGDNRVMWTQPTSGTICMQTVLPEYALTRGALARVPSYNVVIGSPKSWPLLSWEQMAYVQIDLVGSFTAAAGCVIYDGGAWPDEYNGDYFTTEPTINIVHHERLTPKGSSYQGRKLPGREETEFIRSKDMWWRPIEVRVGPDGAIYLGDFYNQAVIHNDTRGPDHNKVNAAVRPDRDHYFGRIWKINHKRAKKLEVPDLAKARVADLVKAIEHPNRAVRMNAFRLLLDLPNPVPPRTHLWINGEPEQYADMMETNYGYKSLLKLALDPTKPAEPRIAAMWILGRRDADVLMLGYGWSKGVFADKDPVVRRNAALISELPHYAINQRQQSFNFLTGDLIPLLSDPDAQTRLAALRALGSTAYDDTVAKALIAAWPKLDDDFQKSAAIGAASRNSAGCIAAALAAPDPSSLTPLINNLVSRLAEASDSAAAAKLVIALADKPAAADDLKARILDTLGKALKNAPTMTPELRTALTALLGSGASASALPVAVKWDAGRGEFAAAISEITSRLLKTLADTTADDGARVAAVRSLLGIRGTNAGNLDQIRNQLAAENPASFKKALIAALGETNDQAVGSILVQAYAKLPLELQGSAFDVLLKRADWALALLEGVKGKTVDAAAFGPANAYRLRTHPAKEVAERAAAMGDDLNPGEKAKNEVIAKLTPVVSKPGSMSTGKIVFTATCAICHKLGQEGREVGPDLTGIGAHGPAELLTHIIDPNREVDPTFRAWNIETTEGEFQAGIIARENRAAITLRNAAGDFEIPVAKIKSRVDTGLSLMPEGLDALGGEVLRDVLTYMCGGEATHRIVDLANAFTADGRRGIFASADSVQESVRIKKFGNLAVEGVPFYLADPSKTVSARNLVVLKGGGRGTVARDFPQRVEVPVGVAAPRLHLLSGVAGWAWPFEGDEAKGRPALKMVVKYQDGPSEEFVFQNGVEFADYIGEASVPGSKRARDLTNGGQLRWIVVQPKRQDVIRSLELQSFDNGIAPVIAAITAELPRSGAAAPTPTTNAPAAPASWGAGQRVLLVGGGSSHDFAKWFNECDSATLKAAGFATRYTEEVDEATRLLSEADVLLYSTNQAPFGGLGFQAALRKAADAGKGLVLLHPGLWYNFGANQEYNRVFVGGGSRGHDAIGEFEVKLAKPDHPVLAGLSGDFKITDELYYSKFDPAGSPSEVLATATSPKSGQTFPSLWTVKHDHAKIVCIAPGHDGRVHELPEFKKILVNAVKWAAPKKN